MPPMNAAWDVMICLSGWKSGSNTPNRNKVFAPREKMNTTTLYLASFLPLRLPPLSLLYVNDSFSEL